MPEPKPCSLSVVLRNRHMSHLWRWHPDSPGTWQVVAEEDQHQPGVYACDGESTKAPAVADV